MHFLKALGIFLLLVSGNTGFAFSFPDQGKQSDDQVASFQLSEDVSEVFESTLTGFDISSLRLFTPQAPDFYFHSLRESVEAESYVSYSRSIDPGLDVTDIIFPFHTFL